MLIIETDFAPEIEKAKCMSNEEGSNEKVKKDVEQI